MEMDGKVLCFMKHKFEVLEVYNFTSPCMSFICGTVK
jgi:hypothetical protein